MPLKNGRITPKEKRFIEAMARTGEAEYSATKAGYSRPEVMGSQIMKQRPEIRARVLERASELLFTELLPLALDRHKMLLTANGVPAGAQLGAVKLAYDRTLGEQQEHVEKEPSEMTYDELNGSIARLEREARERAEAARDITPPSVFD